jgi:hypothetical protein
MRSKTLAMAAVGVALCSASSVCAADTRLEETAVEAYVYGYPLVLMEVTRRIATNVETPQDFLAPVNQLGQARVFPDHTFRDVVRPNVDTLYSTLFFDVADEPLILSMPDTNGRYYMLPMLDMWTEVFAAPGSRTTGTEATQFAICGPDWKGRLPNDVIPIRAPTNQGWMIGRILTNGPSDIKAVRAIQDQMRITPLSARDRAPKHRAHTVDTSLDMLTPPPVQVAEMSAKEFFETFAELMRTNPPHEIDWNIVQRMRSLGIEVGRELDFDGLPSDARLALEAAPAQASRLISGYRNMEFVDGWTTAVEGMGSYGASYLRRAYVAYIGLGANLPEDAVYPLALADVNGRPFDGSNQYVLHFDEQPPVNGFWSLTIYDSDGYLVDNPVNRYALGDRNPLQVNDDGSIDIYIQQDPPDRDHEANWLPAPPDAFNLVLRLYDPRLEILTSEWQAPGVRRVK